MDRRQPGLFSDFDSDQGDLWRFEKRALDEGYSIVAGVDEVGRGPLAGPVVSVAAILPPHSALPYLDDSKRLTPKRRETLYEEIYGRSLAIGLGIVDPGEIDRRNILQASLRSMAIAVSNLSPQPDFLLIDGVFQISSDIPQATIVKGDARSGSIAAASIVAKVTRDRLMVRYHDDYPEFGFNRHKGYPTQAHKKAIQRHGICPIHRRTFKGVREYA